MARVEPGRRIGNRNEWTQDELKIVAEVAAVIVRGSIRTSVDSAAGRLCAPGQLLEHRTRLAVTERLHRAVANKRRHLQKLERRAAAERARYRRSVLSRLQSDSSSDSHDLASA